MKTEITKTHNLRGRITGYMASNDYIHAAGKTPKEAKQALDKISEECLSNLIKGVRFNRFQNHVLSVFPTVSGWSYWIDTFNPDYYIGPYSTMEEAENRAFYHLAQNLWSLNITNDSNFLSCLPEIVKNELHGWIKWQRSYAMLKSQGLSDNDAHLKASSF